MTELEKIFLTSAVTIFGGLFVYVTGQLLSKFLIEPTHELKKTIGEIRFNLAFYAGIIHTPISRNPERSQKAYDALMKSSCDLLARVNAIPFYSTLSSLSFGFLPLKQAIIESAVQLRGLSTYVHETDSKANDALDIIAKRVAKIEKNLGIESLSERPPNAELHMPNDSNSSLKSIDFTNQRNQAVSSAVTALVLINGGAAVALLAFLQAMWAKSNGALYAVVAAMLFHCMGVLLAALITIFRYQASLYFQGRNNAKYDCYNFWFYAAWVGSMLAFLLGVSIVGVGLLIALCQRSL